ncbi:hypothetical protein J6590_044472 [Homalodisca vitripennis]|nr:hypothetical protein J6590_044472 [Homalodisca vitripennis]
MLQKHHHHQSSEGGHEEELNDIQIRLQFSSSRAGGSGGGGVGSGGGSISRDNIALPRPTAGHKTPSGPLTGSLVSISKANSTTSSNMTASVVVNLPTSYPNSDIDYASPASPSPSSPVASSDQQPEDTPILMEFKEQLAHLRPKMANWERR